MVSKLLERHFYFESTAFCHLFNIPTKTQWWGDRDDLALRVFTAPSEDLSSVDSTHTGWLTTVCETLAPEGPTPSSGL